MVNRFWKTLISRINCIEFVISFLIQNKFYRNLFENDIKVLNIGVFSFYCIVI